ncbi:MAG: hypothetical protein KGN02_06540 [bacterium]|nr:hypothetical protein [bacterium]
MNDDVDTGEEMVEEMGLDGGAFAVDDRQRFELLRRWHREEAKPKPDQSEKKKKRDP